jgi:25S rRNA (adenine2142-N1)-methyltransferase
LLKQQKYAQDDALASINCEIEALGGLGEYQRMSCIGQSNDRGGGSEKVLIGWLKQMGWADAIGKEKQRHRYVQVVCSLCVPP